MCERALWLCVAVSKMIDAATSLAGVLLHPLVSFLKGKISEVLETAIDQLVDGSKVLDYVLDSLSDDVRGYKPIGQVTNACLTY